jgi:hypothetical protein
VIRQVLRDYGHDIYLQRRVADNLEVCRKAQYSPVLEKHTTRHMHGGSMGLSGAADDMEEGLVTSAEHVYWFQWDVNPREGDRIYEPDPRYDDDPDPRKRYQSLWEIDFAQPMREKRGRIAFWACGVTRTSPD